MAEVRRVRPGGGSSRPAGRRAQILRLAADLFHRGGYHQVSMAEVAAGLGITAPALYRHVRGKPELLHQVVRSGLDALGGALAPARGAAELCAALSTVAIEHRPLGTLWQRDSRLLPARRRAELRRELRADVRLMAGVLRVERPELAQADAEFLCWSALSVYGGLSHHGFAPPRRRFERLLRDIGTALLAVGFAGARVEPPVLAGPPPAGPGRREELLSAAVRLFHERGFDNVSTDQLGAAVGMSGPSVYHHFDSKAALLAASLVRSRERLRHEVGAAITGATPADAALEAGLRAYVGFARRHGHYLGAMLSETERLAPVDRKVAVDFRRDFLRTWVGLLRQVRPEYDDAEARIRVHSMFALVNDGVRHRPHSERADLADCLERMARAVLGL
ncbi:TetR family transcriptional regulator [Kitasatospora sp. NBC_00240]|uniref:TetR/AcrR family transcriptional regulator n=1 Tax=Kitasatospora sp. NBC_00240 TaxID=2903567 RepID=UPI0022509D1E|nr:TetR/AcrR family transcriptional regulator [Kitasatospora sp. NBC_00240]MCX5212112.1 TetR family transcriptional regulator [Kitasatospora sp. NBC_00240]